MKLEDNIFGWNIDGEIAGQNHKKSGKIVTLHYLK